MRVEEYPPRDQGAPSYGVTEEKTSPKETAVIIDRPDSGLIPRFTPGAAYNVHVEWGYLEEFLERQRKDIGLDLDPDFQRVHVWDELRQRRFVEYCLRGGATGRDLLFNSKGWQRQQDEGPLVLVDGKQRLEAVRLFMADELKAFGWKLSDFGNHRQLLRMNAARFRVHVNDLATRAEVLQWYIDVNAGGVAHTDDEIEKVREMLAREDHAASTPQGSPP
jgi:hypothetical protein